MKKHYYPIINYSVYMRCVFTNKIVIIVYFSTITFAYYYYNEGRFVN